MKVNCVIIFAIAKKDNCPSLTASSLNPPTRCAIYDHLQCSVPFRHTDIFGFSANAYSDTPLTVTVLVNFTLTKSVLISKYLLTLTLFPCPEGVAVTKDVCTEPIAYSDCVLRQQTCHHKQCVTRTDICNLGNGWEVFYWYAWKQKSFGHGECCASTFLSPNHR